MPELVLILLIVLSFMFTLMLLRLIGETGPLFLFTSMLCAGLAGWYYAASDFTVPISKENKYQSQTLEGKDIIIIDADRIVNLNSRFGKDIPEGTTIKQTIYPAYTFNKGVWFSTGKETFEVE